MIDCNRYCGCVKGRNTSDDQSSLSFFQTGGNLDIRYGLIGFRGYSVSCGYLRGKPTQAAVSPNARRAINLLHEESATLLMLIRLP